MNTLGKRVKTLRKHLKLNQKDFGERIGLKQTSISGLEKDEYIPRESTLKSICSEFNVNYLWLTTGSGEMIATSKFDDIKELVDIYFPEESNEFKKTLNLILKLEPEALKGLNTFMESLLKKKE